MTISENNNNSDNTDGIESMERGGGKEESVCVLKPMATNNFTVTIPVWCTIFGSVLLTMPFCLEKSGLTIGIAIIVIMGVVGLYSSYALLQVYIYHGSAENFTDLPELAGMLLGPQWESVARFFSINLLLGLLIIYWIITADFLNYIMSHLMTEEIVDKKGMICEEELFLPIVHLGVYDFAANVKVQWSSKFAQTVWLAIVILPLITIRQMNALKRFNRLGLYTVFITFTFVCCKCGFWRINTVSLFNHYAVKPTVFILPGVLSLTHCVNDFIIPLLRREIDTNTSDNSRRTSPIIFSFVFRELLLTYVIITSFHVIISSVFYMTFPLRFSCLPENFLNTFSNSDLFSNFIRCFFIFQLLTSFLLVAFTLRSQLYLYFKIKNPSFLLDIFANLIIVFISSLFSLYLPRISMISSFIGSSSGFFLIFCLPCLLHMKSLSLRKQLTNLYATIDIFIPILGLINFVSLVITYFYSN